MSAFPKKRGFEWAQPESPSVMKLETSYEKIIDSFGKLYEKSVRAETAFMQRSETRKSH